MSMGRQPRQILYVGHGAKLAKHEQLDLLVRTYTEKNHPTFMKAPATWTQPNETSWTYYRKQRPTQPAY